jgi:hypothetical protein
MRWALYNVGVMLKDIDQYEKMLGVSSKIQNMLGDIKNISSICFWVTRGHKKNTMG